LLVKPKSKKEMHRQWKQGQVPWEECCPAVQEGQGAAGAELGKGMQRIIIRASMGMSA